MSRPGHPTTHAVAEAIETMHNALFREYGADYAFTVAARGRLLAASGVSCPRVSCHVFTGNDVVEAVVCEPENRCTNGAVIDAEKK